MTLTDRDERILSDLMDMYGNYIITQKEYFQRAMDKYDIPHEIVDEYFNLCKWRRKGGKNDKRN